MTEEALTSPRPAAGVVRRLSFLLPVAIFGIVAVGLGVGLTRNPQEIPSALIGQEGIVPIHGLNYKDRPADAAK